MIPAHWLAGLLVFFLFVVVIFFYCMLRISTATSTYVFAVSVSLSILVLVTTTIVALCNNYNDEGDAQGCFLFATLILACLFVAFTLIVSVM